MQTSVGEGGLQVGIGGHEGHEKHVCGYCIEEGLDLDCEHKFVDNSLCHEYCCSHVSSVAASSSLTTHLTTTTEFIETTTRTDPRFALDLIDPKSRIDVTVASTPDDNHLPTTCRQRRRLTSRRRRRLQMLDVEPRDYDSWSQPRPRRP